MRDRVIIIAGAVSSIAEIIDRSEGMKIKLEPRRMSDMPVKLAEPMELLFKPKRDWEQRKYKKGKQK